MNHSYCTKRFLLILSIAAMFSTAVKAEPDSGYTPQYLPTLHISRTQGSIAIDGELNDSGWRGAGRAANFAEHQPGDQTKPPVETVAFITYDEDHLYVAYVCYDDPSTVRASLCERDRLFADDNIGFFFDTYGDAAWAYVLNVNPYGVQADALWSSNAGEDSGYDLIWKSAGKVTDSGWQVEMAIPFASLRFPNRPTQTWKVDFWRNHPRDSRRQYSWAAYDRDEPCWPCKWGTITGIEDVRPGKGIELLPTAIGYQSGSLLDSDDPHSAFENDDPDGQISLGGKYTISSNVTAEVTYNPDFSQVESDPAQIDVNTTFALFYQERRPFFQEGSDLFNTIFNAVYTRSINDPDYAGKMTARMNRTSIAYLVARDEHTPIILPFEENSRIIQTGKSTSNIFRARQTFGEDSRVGLLVTDRRLDGGGSGTLLSADGALRLSQKYRFEWQVIGTHSEEPNDTMLTYDENDTLFNSMLFGGGAHTAGFDGESYWGHAVYSEISREARNSYVDISYLERSPTFRADNGFEPKNDQRSVRMYAQYTFRSDDGLIERITPSVNVGTIWNFDGKKKDEFVRMDLSAQLKAAQTHLHTQHMRSSENLGGIQFDNIWNLHFCGNSRFGDLLAVGFALNHGHQIARCEDPPVMGSETSFYPWVDIKPMDRLLIELWFNYMKSDHVDTGEELFKGYTTRTRLSYQFTRELSLRLVAQYNDFSERFDIEPLLTYRVNAFTKFYIGMTGSYQYYDRDDHSTLTGSEWELSSRQFFAKLQYLFRM